ncbi:MAG TPA: N-methyl-L-tryptophan oxidase [Thermoanaerobaculia bacterium]
MVSDVIVVGLGAMGSAAAAHLAARGQRVLALERFELGHERGSSHGLTRIIRLAYFEHPSYVPLVRRAFELWRELESAAGERLLHVTGALDVGPEGSEVFAGSLAACRQHALSHEVLDAAALARRVPAWRPAPDARAILQPDGGFLAAERAVAAHAARAAAAGAELRCGERVREWAATSHGVRVVTERAAYEAEQLVLAAGAWLPALVPSLAPLLVPERQVLGWFAVADRAPFAPERFPVFVLDAEEGRFYGFPEHAAPGLKIGKYHHLGERVDPETMERVCRDDDERALRGAVARYFPAADGALLDAKPCLFTNTPDEHFVIDRHPDAPQVLLVSPCSGHGFKFAPVVGEIVADLVERGETAHDIARFRLARFAAGAPSA